MIGQRAAVLLTLGPLAVLLVYLGGWPYLVGVTILLSLAVVEYSRLMHSMAQRVPAWLILPLCWLIYLGAWFGAVSDLRLMAATLAIALLVTLGHALWRFEAGDAGRAATDWFAAISGLLLLGWGGAHLLLLRQLGPEQGGSGWVWTLLVLLAAWSADTFAFMVGSYVAGRLGLGRHALSPQLSPKKTTEGFVGGVLLGTALTLAVGSGLLHVTWWLALLLGLLVTTVGTLGDLGISLLKRTAGVKDSGNLFPGHGGALDRLDSIVWTVTITYYFIYLLSSIHLGL